jgi:hypothetical protein
MYRRRPAPERAIPPNTDRNAAWPALRCRFFLLPSGRRHYGDSPKRGSTRFPWRLHDEGRKSTTPALLLAGQERGRSIPFATNFS